MYNNGGSKQDVSGGASSDNSSGEIASSEDASSEDASNDKASSEDPCPRQGIYFLASELGFTTKHADDLLGFIRKFTAAEERDKLVGAFCDK
jgi:hypothetical protein